MLLPNSDYPVQVSKPQERIALLAEPLRQMERKDQAYVLAKSLKSGEYAVFRKFDEKDNHDIRLNNGTVENWMEWTIKMLKSRVKLQEYEIIDQSIKNPA